MKYDMDNWLAAQGVKEVDWELIDMLKGMDQEIDVMFECLKSLLLKMRDDLNAATEELQRRDQAVALWQQRWNIELEKRIEAERKLAQMKEKK